MSFDVIVIGTSLGGLAALETVIGGLTEKLSVPIVIVQHRSKSSFDLLGSLLQRHTGLRVKEAEDKDLLDCADVFVAPADYHILIEPGSCALSLEEPLNFARPSIDILFESAAQTYRQGVIAVVLTGANSDGANGAKCVKAEGGMVVVQDPTECESDRMPLATMAAVKVDRIMKLNEIAPFLIEQCRRME
ncbi:MAG: chemotaxis protein CheB [Candidatus Obscuribacterales bacterium]|nr:chemotaxis protein CheB [Candidatus Obscuribacterales bacterium]